MADDFVELVKQLRAFDLLMLGLPSDRPDVLSITIQIEGAERTIDLWRVPVWAEDATVHVYREGGEVEVISAPRSGTYRGTVQGIDGSRVTAGFKGDGLHATIRLPEEPVRSLVPLDGLGLHLLHRADDLPTAPMICEQPVVEPAVEARHDHPHGTGEESIERGSESSTHVAELALDSDVEYFNWNGNVADTLDEMALVVNNMNECYERDVNISHVLTHAIVRTAEPDPYTSIVGSEINQEQATEWTTNQSHVAYDLVLMFTDKDTWAPAPTGNGLLGRAKQIGDVCNRSEAFCFSEARSSDTTQAQIVAHELGHLWDGRHCDWHFNDDNEWVPKDPAAGCSDSES